MGVAEYFSITLGSRANAMCSITAVMCMTAIALPTDADAQL